MYVCGWSSFHEGWAVVDVCCSLLIWKQVFRCVCWMVEGRGVLISAWCLACASTPSRGFAFEFFPDGFWHAMLELWPTNQRLQKRRPKTWSTNEPMRKDGLHRYALLGTERKCFVKSDLCCLDLALTRVNMIWVML